MSSAEEEVSRKRSEPAGPEEAEEDEEFIGPQPVGPQDEPKPTKRRKGNISSNLSSGISF
jgi:hypothetical protein